MQFVSTYLPYVFLLLIGLAGMVANFFKRRVKGETLSDFAGYYLKVHVGYTLASIAATCGTILYMLHSGSIPLHSLHSLIVAFTTGFMSDAIINRDAALLTLSDALGAPVDTSAAPTVPGADSAPSKPLVAALPVEAVDAVNTVEATVAPIESVAEAVAGNTAAPVAAS